MRRLLAATALALAAPLTLTAPAANAGHYQPHDPGIMSRLEYDNVQPPQTKAHVEADCGCTGTYNGFTGTHNGWTYKDYEYSAFNGTGVAVIVYRKADDGYWRVFWKKGDCPLNGELTGNCDWYFFA